MIGGSVLAASAMCSFLAASAMSRSSWSVGIPVTFSRRKASVFVLDQNHVVIVRLSVASTKRAIRHPKISTATHGFVRKFADRRPPLLSFKSETATASVGIKPDRRFGVLDLDQN